MHADRWLSRMETAPSNLSQGVGSSVGAERGFQVQGLRGFESGCCESLPSTHPVRSGRFIGWGYALALESGCCCARPVVEGAQARLRPVPLLGSLAGKAAEILFGVTQYYTYTSAS